MIRHCLQLLVEPRTARETSWRAVSDRKPRAYADSNFVGPLNMVELARHRGVRHMVYASSSSVYGNNAKVPFSVEDRVDHPISLYAATKKADQLMSETYAHLYRVPLTGLRFFTVYGPCGRPDMMPWIFASKILAGEPIPVFNHGRMQRDFTYIDDIVAGVLATLDSPPADDGCVKPGSSRTPHAVYNIGNNRSEPLLRFIELLEQACGRKAEVQFMPIQPGDVERTFADIDAIQRDVGYRPSTPIDVGLSRFVDWSKATTAGNAGPGSGHLARAFLDAPHWRGDSMRSLWYVSKYMTMPGDRVGERSMLLLRELHHLGWKVTAFASDSNHLVAGPQFSGTHHVRTVDGVDVWWVRTRKYRRAKSLGRILSWLDFEYRLSRLPWEKFGRPDAVIVSSLSLLSIFSGLAMRRKYGCKLIFEVRDIWPLTIVEEGGSGARNPFVQLLGWIERLAYRKSDAIVGTMPNLAEHVREVAGETGPVFCIPMGIDEQLVKTAEPLDPGYPDEHIPKGKFIVCHAGTIGITNALDTLLECARELKDRPGIHFLVVGEGDLKEHYRALCADLPNVSFPPSVTKAQVQSLLGQCDLLYFSVHPSRVWRFGQSLNKIIDYMLSGKPVVGSYTGFPSMVNEAGSGVFVPAGDVAALKAEIERYADMPEAERARQGEGGRRWLLEHRTYPRLARDYADLIEATLAG